jgi:hypothetical protein
MTRLECPGCSTIYDVSQYPSGHAFACVCGRDLEVAPASTSAREAPPPRTLFLLALPFFSVALVQNQPADDAAACASCGACGACGGTLLLFPIVWFAVNVVLVIWVGRDAKARGQGESAVLWMLLVFFTGILGWAIYFFSRTKGALVPCPTCGNRRLQSSATCPHCGNP